MAAGGTTRRRFLRRSPLCRGERKGGGQALTLAGGRSETHAASEKDGAPRAATSWKKTAERSTVRVTRRRGVQSVFAHQRHITRPRHGPVTSLLVARVASPCSQVLFRVCPLAKTENPSLRCCRDASRVRLVIDPDDTSTVVLPWDYHCQRSRDSRGFSLHLGRKVRRRGSLDRFRLSSVVNEE